MNLEKRDSSTPDGPDLGRAGLIGAIQLAAAELSLTKERITERVLSPLLRAAIESQELSDLDARWEHHLKFDDKTWHRDPGGLDLSFWTGDRLNSAVELKWCGGKYLTDCAWDVVKLSTGLAEGLVSHAYMLAGASTAFWNEGRNGAELFDSEVWELREHLNAYSSEFAFWRTDILNYPKKLPAAWMTSAIHSETFNLESGQEWQLRLAEVRSVDPQMERIDYVPSIRTDLVRNRHLDLDALFRLKKSGELQRIIGVNPDGKIHLGEDGDTLDD